MKRRFKKDYHKKDYKNPFFQNRQKDKKPKQRRLKLSSCLFLVALAGWFIFLFFSPFFRIENINFGDTNKELEKKIQILLEAEFEKRKLIFFSNQNYFIFDANDLSNQLNAMFLLNELKIEKQFPDKLIIKAKEKSDALVLIADNNAFFVDKNGLVVDLVPELFKTYSLDEEGLATTTIDHLSVIPTKLELSDEITRKMPVVSVQDVKEVNIRDKALSKELVDLVLKVYENLLNKLGVSIELLKIEEVEDIEEAKLTITTKDGWEIYFSINEPIDNQLENLKVILQEKVGDERNLLDYIDLRFGDKVYFKMK
ncbi:MAG: hypothetical protein HQ536_04545 [Parcubacteria group bacterium]|nr:hypothetical protein [Parcubacteria group bacterium]